MIIVSGAPRSGTSCMMDCLRHALGEDRIMCGKPPWQDAAPLPDNHRFAELQKVITKKQDQLREKLKDTESAKQRQKRKEKARYMNPKGFWECKFTVKGVRWMPRFRHDPNMVCKIVSQGLAKSDPQFIGKIIFMIRHPQEQAWSARHINIRELPFDQDAIGPMVTPKMFIRVTFAAAIWILREKPDLLIVHHRDLMTKPNETLSTVREFLGEGDFAQHPVDPELYRNKLGDYKEPNEFMKIAIRMYEAVLQGDWQKVIDIYKETNTTNEVRRNTGQHPCFRMGRKVSYRECGYCRSNPEVAGRYRRAAENKGIEWENEPCAFEIGVGVAEDVEGGYKTADVSIRDNHWQYAIMPKPEAKCKYMTLGEKREGCGCWWIVCQNPDSPILNVPRVWDNRKCNKTRCAFYQPEGESESDNRTDS